MADISLKVLLTRAEAARKSGDIRSAAAQYEAILHRFPANRKAKKALLDLSKQPPSAPQSLPEAVRRHIMQALSSGMMKEAIELSSKATQVYPQAFQGWLLRGVTLQAVGDFAHAEKAFDIAIRLNPSSAAAYYNRGLMLQHLKNSKEAKASYEACLLLEPTMLDALNNLGVVLRDSGQLEQARARWQQVLDIEPKHVDALINWGNSCVDERDMDTGIAFYQRAVAAQPAHSLALANLCEAYEKSNQLDALDALLASVDPKLVGRSPALDLQLASRDFRNKDFAACCAQLDAIEADRESLEFRSKYFELLGKSREKLSAFDPAFAAYHKLNQVVAQNWLPYRDSAMAYLARAQDRAKDDWADFGAVIKRAAAASEDEPVFLVGFPRSGTTLLDTFLRGHGDVQVFEETDAVARMLGTLPAEQSLEDLVRLPAKQKQTMRDAYQGALAQHSKLDGRRLWIDKLPLNMVRVAEILTAFPRAKFILALRHPLDCILSCYKQNFVINTGMYLMTDLSWTAQLYDASFTLFSKAIEASGASCHQLRYEDLLEDKHSALQGVVEFLGLLWDENTLDHEATAKGRGKINTPSYSQVTQPLYADSTYLWRNYASKLADAEALVQPWIARHGYSGSGGGAS